jgi:acetyl/propionyl-CoA carboxylase alpha subunit
MTMPIRRLLVANRGEIASRVIRTARAMDIFTVAVHSEADADAPYVHEADIAVALAGNAPSETYLRSDLLVEAARASGCDAVHPGYGFLSENAGFARACAEAGLVFVGPSPEAIESMGSKTQAKDLMAAAGVPVLPGIVIEDAASLPADLAERAGSEVGFPILVKAAYGGGGRGMRIVQEAGELVETVASASREAESSFGNGTVFLEHYVESPRHVEVQIFGDQHGNVVHLFERECSIQRRYQKVIEEAPSPFVSTELREELGAAAVALARKVGYTSAGTVEMVMDQEGNGFFLEMNTRLQVEHPVTELVTGVDIVAEQIRVAAGEKLSLTQDEVTLTGSAIEARVYAEDAYHGYVPAIGPLRLVRFPSGPGVRVDHGVLQGDSVTAAFDPMIAKVVGYGADRTEAIAALSGALRETVLLGTITNTAFLADVVEHPDFAAGETHTGFLDEHPALTEEPRADADAERLLIAAAALASPRFDTRFDVPAAHARVGEWRP